MQKRAQIALKIVVLAPPANVWYTLQDKKKVLSALTVTTGADISFDLTVEADGQGDFYGPMVSGPKGERFIYLCIGTSSGQHNSPWTRRMKVPLKNVPPGQKLVARVNGTAKDGSPACATVPLLDGGWQVEKP